MRRGLQGYAGQGPTGPGDRRPGARAVVAVVGAGAAGTLTAIHLVDRAARADRALRPRAGRPAARAGSRRRLLDHRPPAPPQRPGRRHERAAGPARPPRRLAARARRTPTPRPPTSSRAPTTAATCDDTLAEALRRRPAASPSSTDVSASRHARPVPGGVHLALADGSVLTADAMVLAPGIFAPGTAWAPDALARLGPVRRRPVGARRARRGSPRRRRRRAARRHRPHHGRRRADPGPPRPHPARRVPPRPGPGGAHDAGQAADARTERPSSPPSAAGRSRPTDLDELRAPGPRHRDRRRPRDRATGAPPSTPCGR